MSRRPRTAAPEPPLLKARIARESDACPFLNDSLDFELRAGEVLWLRGASGAGKSFCCMHLAGLATLPGAAVSAEWDPSVPEAQRIGFLFQKGVLIDSLNLAENLALALRASGEPYPIEAIDAALAAVGLSGRADGSKMPGELSGGMLRRAALAQILAQRKRVVILDEPFVGLDPPVAAEVVALIRDVAERRQVAMVLVSHMEHLAGTLGVSRTLTLERARGEDDGAGSRPTQLGRLPFHDRCGRRLADYLFVSLPLIVCAFAATGAAVSMLLADLLGRVDVVAIVSGFLQTYLKGNPALPMILGLVDRVVKSNEAAAKRKLYALAIGTVFSIELGPLLTALLLAGRIGGAYAGEVSMMAATNQLDLLAVLGVPATGWTFYPALLAALAAAPVLAAAGTAVAIGVGALVGGPAFFDLIPYDEYWAEVRAIIAERQPGTHLLKWAPLVNLYRSLGFMAVTIVIAQLCARWRRRAQPRHVPFIITSAVVLSCLAVLVLDWGFSQLYVRLDASHLVSADPEAIYRDHGAEGGGGDGVGVGPGSVPLGLEPDGAAADGADGNFAEYDAYYAAGGTGDEAEAELAAEDVDGDHDEI